MYNTIIEVQTYGDSSIYTEVILVSEEKLDIKALSKQFQSLRGLPDLDYLPHNMVSDTIDDFIKYLKKSGFKELTTTKVIISD